MPSPKNETVTKDVAKTVKELKGGKIAFKNDETSNIHQVIGKISWGEDKLKENYEVFLEGVVKAKPATIKGIYVRAISICSTMGPGIKVEV